MTKPLPDRKNLTGAGSPETTGVQPFAQFARSEGSTEAHPPRSHRNVWTSGPPRGTMDLPTNRGGTALTAHPRTQGACTPVSDLRIDVDRLLVEALADVRDGRDAIPKVTEALAALYLEAGEAPASIVLDVAGYAERENESDLACTCPPDLVARGGFTSSCPVHRRPA